MYEYLLRCINWLHRLHILLEESVGTKIKLNIIFYRHLEKQILLSGPLIGQGLKLNSRAYIFGLGPKISARLHLCVNVISQKILEGYKWRMAGW